MGNVKVSMKMSPKQAGALYMKCMRLEEQNNNLKIAGSEVLNNCMSELGFRSEKLWVATKISSGSLSFRESAERLAELIAEEK